MSQTLGLQIRSRLQWKVLREILRSQSLIAVNTLERMDIAVLPTVYFVSILIVSILFARTWRMFVAESW